ncbi:hypothetical protein AAH211_09575, partial [Serratia fonticola]|uniref:hypothetical protein n=1 Tax=Serratia fonticola TaxID=47917 RepID=UPI003988153A
NIKGGSQVQDLTYGIFGPPLHFGEGVIPVCGWFQEKGQSDLSIDKIARSVPSPQGEGAGPKL